MSLSKQIERYVTELLSLVPLHDYVELMRWLSDWASGQADAAEYTLDMDESDD